MPSKRIRQRIAKDAARLLYEGQEQELAEARLRAMRDSGFPERVTRRNIPRAREILDCVDALTLEHEGEHRPANQRETHLSALKLLWQLAPFDPRLVSADAGAGSCSATILLDVACGDSAGVRRFLDALGVAYVTEDPPSNAEQGYRFQGRTARQSQLTVQLTVHVTPIAGAAPARTGATADEFEAFIRRAYPDADLEALRNGDETWADPYVVFSLLLQRLEGVKQKPEHHPEGDALYHSLQAFDLAREQFPYDEEFLQAALLHDVGKGIDSARHVESAVEALHGLISPRTEFLIRHHAAARRLRDGSLSGRLRDELLSSPWRADLMALLEIDDAARRPGVAAPSASEAIDYLRSLAAW